MPYITYIVIIICVVNYIRQYQLEQVESLDAALQKCGALIKPLSSNKEIYRLLTAGFVHMSIPHLLMNMYCMYYLGSAMESYLGHFLFLLLLLGSIIAGNICTLNLGDECSISGGLSGGLYGLMCFELKIIVMLGGVGTILSNSSLLLTIILNISLNFMSGVGYKAHLGGAIFGLLFAVIIAII